jgi:hypothetical protein
MTDNIKKLTNAMVVVAAMSLNVAHADLGDVWSAIGTVSSGVAAVSSIGNLGKQVSGLLGGDQSGYGQQTIAYDSERFTQAMLSLTPIEKSQMLVSALAIEQDMETGDFHSMQIDTASLRGDMYSQQTNKKIVASMLIDASNKSIGTIQQATEIAELVAKHSLMPAQYFGGLINNAQTQGQKEAVSNHFMDGNAVKDYDPVQSCAALQSWAAKLKQQYGMQDMSASIGAAILQTQAMQNVVSELKPTDGMIKGQVFDSGVPALDGLVVVVADNGKTLGMPANALVNDMGVNTQLTIGDKFLFSGNANGQIVAKAIQMEVAYNKASSLGR